MNAFKRFQIVMALVSCVGFVLPTSVVLGATPAKNRVQDVSAGANGGLEGKVMDRAGHAVAGIKVRVQQAGQVVAEANTGIDGSFTFKNLRGGVYQVATPGTSTLFRLWAAKTAPPHAAQAALVVTEAGVVRGQCCTGPTSDCGTSCGTASCGSQCGTACGSPSPCGDSCTSCGSECGGCGGECGGCGGCGSSCGNVWPWVIAAGAAAAIAIPLALDDDDDDNAS